MFFKRTTLFILFLPLFLNAQENYSNRWKEISRTDRKDKSVAYTDTMRINNVTKESLKMRRGSFEYSGTISNDLLEVGEEQYQIIKQDEKEIRIGDEDYIHIFARESKDLSAADATAAINERTLPLKPVSSIDTFLLKGEWQAYSRKRKDGPGKINYKELIKTLSFHPDLTMNNYGIVTINNGISMFPIRALKGSDIIISDDNNKEHRIIVWKLTKDELIVEDDSGILYYMKQF
ncbi:hypothetical protein F0919_00965 [Taibaiella lutea]|uniref:Lipocalin-like domain-containing protein n=1 Tax=Taibaiella lutea TaxID=2608001 RepID=A0A5M6CM20_9BACT|nr:hypothetical protein [Taibaiella lutea]KAA5536268.1 hypothetical protein F0919_00965 [Taibaiella lutea]